MSIVWELQKGGDRRALRDWGITRAALKHVAWAPDELALTVAGRDAATAAPLFAYLDVVTLWRVDGASQVRFFSGRITSPEHAGSSRSEAQTYVASGPWWALERLVYEESRYVASDPTDPDSALVEVYSSRAVLFANLAGTSQTPAQQTSAAVAFANSRGAGITLGSNSLSFAVPWEEASDVTVAEVLKRGARYAPDAVQWLDYSAATPTLHIAQRSALATVTIDLLTGGVQEFSVTPLEHLRVPGVRLYYEEVVQLANGKSRSKLTVQNAGTPTAIGAVIATIELGAQGSAAPEPVPTDLAATYYAAVGVLHYGGRLRIKARDCDGSLRPGKKLNLTGGLPAWASMGAIIQSTTMDLFAGTTEVEFGLSATLGAQSFVDFLRYQRLRNKSSYLDTRRTGEGNTSAVPGNITNFTPGADKGFVDIELCAGADGTPARTIRVWAETISVA